jgi:uncharacterized RDD family membrane protein YckC
MQSARNEDLPYASFGDRFMAFLLDSFVQLPIVGPFLWFLLREDIMSFAGDPVLLAEQLTASLESPMGRLILYGIPLVYCVLFWKFKSATPGKMLLEMKIVDATTGGAPGAGRLVLRYVGYIVCVLSLCIGFLWIAFDKRRQGWHDKMANTIVVMTPRKPPAQNTRG